MAERETERVVYTDGGGRGAGSTAIVALVIVALLVVLFLVFGRGLLNGSDTKKIDANVDIHTPATSGNGG